MTHDTAIHIRKATLDDRPALLEIWERSVRATHHFLAEKDIQELRVLVRDQALANLDLWVLTHQDVPAGFMGMDGNHIEALFVDPSHHRKGYGSLLLHHAESMHAELLLSVNEQNPAARHFYEQMGFTIVERSEVDGQGRPFPLLHMRRPAGH